MSIYYFVKKTKKLRNEIVQFVISNKFPRKQCYVDFPKKLFPLHHYCHSRSMLSLEKKGNKSHIYENISSKKIRKG